MNLLDIEELEKRTTRNLSSLVGIGFTVDLIGKTMKKRRR